MTKKSKTTRMSIAVVTALIMVMSVMSMLFAACGSKVEISLNKTEAELYVGDSVKITATVTGDDDAEVEWSSSDTTVATVRRGTVNAVKEGSAVITAQVEGGASATCNITVKDRTVTIAKPSEPIVIDLESADPTYTLTATASDNGAISWTSSDPTVATVENGVITAHDIGKATITASRVSANDSCEVEVIAPNRPEDYYKLAQTKNIDVCNDPGVWHYWGDGNRPGDYDFEIEPVHQNNTVTATLNVIPNVENGKYFYFRYQPELGEVGSYYTIKVAVTVSADANVRLGSRAKDDKFAALNVDLTANAEQEFEYVGYKNGSEPFTVRINSPVEADKVTLTVRLISIEAHDGQNLPEYHTHEPEPEKNYELIPNDTAEYNLEQLNNAGTANDPGVWHFWPGENNTVKSAAYNNGTLTFSFDKLISSGNNQLRFRPNFDGDVNIKFEFTVTGNVDANVTLGICDSANGNKTVTSKTQTINADGSVTFSLECTLKPAQIIYIEVKAKTGEEKADAVFTFTDVKLYKEIPADDPTTEPAA